MLYLTTKSGCFKSVVENNRFTSSNVFFFKKKSHITEDNSISNPVPGKSQTMITIKRRQLSQERGYNFCSDI